MGKVLTAAEIKETRQRYGMSQRTFARVLGIGEASIVRYESGIEPTRANSNLIRAAANPAFMLDCLEREGGLISEESRNNVEQIIYAELKLDEQGGVMNMDEVYAITLQQEVLNEKAANMLGELSRLRREAEARGDEALAVIYDDVANQIALAKFSIISEENSNNEKLAEIRGQIDALMKFAQLTHAKVA